MEETDQSAWFNLFIKMHTSIFFSVRQTEAAAAAETAARAAQMDNQR